MIDDLFAKGGLSLERLRTFVEIVAASGISKAAPGNPTKQSQYSRQLKELEEYFGAELIQRGKGKFIVTQEGRELFRLVQAQLGGLEEFLKRSTNARVDLRIGAGEAWLNWLVIPALDQFQKRCTKVTPVLHNLTNEEIDQWLADGRLDIGLVRDQKGKVTFRRRSVAAVQYRLFAPGTWRVGRKNPNEGILRNMHIALLDESRISEAILALARKRGFQLNVFLRATSYMQLVQAVQGGYCAAVLPTIARSQFKNGTPKELNLPELDQFDHTIIAAELKQRDMVRPATARAASFLLDIIIRHSGL